jgi:cellulose synthase/poly-beta-1,6-N-acetylglucosamine synthase-like glycosyltransferase
MEGLGDARVRLIPFAQRRGKTAVLNELVPQCRYDVVVLMDARQLVAPGAIRALLARFNDEEVGVVSGELVFRECEEERDEWGGIRGGSGTAEGMGAYWRYEKWIRKNEAVVGSVPGATGACYAMRRALFCRIPPQTILDDVAYPMQAVMQGYRCVFEEQAVVFDVPSCDTQQESVRKRRTLAGNVQLVQLFPGWLLPSRNPIAFQFVSHKILRLFVPFLAIYALIAAVFGVILAENVLFRGVFAVFLLFCAFFAVFCMMGAFFERCGRKGRLFSLFWMFFVLNWVTLLGVLDGLRGRYRVTWDKAY